MHTLAQCGGWGVFEDSCQILTVMPHTALFAKRLAFRSHHFHHHVCAESALQIIYGFKNTVIVHRFGVILLHFFPQIFSFQPLSCM